MGKGRRRLGGRCGRTRGIGRWRRRRGRVGGGLVLGLGGVGLVRRGRLGMGGGCTVVEEFLLLFGSGGLFFQESGEEFASVVPGGEVG